MAAIVQVTPIVHTGQIVKHNAFIRQVKTSNGEEKDTPTIEGVSSSRVVESMSFSQDTNNFVEEEESFSFTEPSSLSDSLK